MPGKLRWAYDSGLLGLESSWQSPGTVQIDLSNINVLATTSQFFVLFSVPVIQSVALQQGAPDAYGKGQARLAAADATRAVGVWPVPVYTAGNPALVSRTSANAVASYATGTVQLILVSGSDTSGTAVSNNLLSAAQSIAALTNIWTALGLTVPAGRQVTNLNVPTATIANAFYLFPGDFVVVQVTAGATAVTPASGSQLFVEMEIL